MPKCEVCRLEKADGEMSDAELCQSCARGLMLPPTRPALRPRVPCARCGGTTLVRCKALRERGPAPQEGGPIAATFHVHLSTAFLTGTRGAMIKGNQPIGLLEAYICRGCGFTELYAHDAPDIPIGPAYGTELFEAGGGGPFR